VKPVPGIREALESLRVRTSELLAALERGELRPEGMAVALESSRRELEKVRAAEQARGKLARDDELLVDETVGELRRLTAVAQDATSRRKNEVERLLERVRAARRAMRFYSATGDRGGAACDLDA
jgi:hypothetical protein